MELFTRVMYGSKSHGILVLFWIMVLLRVYCCMQRGHYPNFNLVNYTEKTAHSLFNVVKAKALKGQLQLKLNVIINLMSVGSFNA